jgi:hypothetical protein
MSFEHMDKDRLAAVQELTQVPSNTARPQDIGQLAVAETGEIMTDAKLYISARTHARLQQKTLRSKEERYADILECIMLNADQNGSLEGRRIGSRIRKALQYTRGEGVRDFSHLVGLGLLSATHDNSPARPYRSFEVRKENIGPAINLGRIAMVEERFLPEGFVYSPEEDENNEDNDNNNERELRFSFYVPGKQKRTYEKPISPRQFNKLKPDEKAALIAGQLSAMRAVLRDVDQWMYSMANKGRLPETFYSPEQIEEMFAAAAYKGYVEKDDEGYFVLTERGVLALPDQRDGGNRKR